MLRSILRLAGRIFDPETDIELSQMREDLEWKKIKVRIIVEGRQL